MPEPRKPFPLRRVLGLGALVLVALLISSSCGDGRSTARSSRAVSGILGYRNSSFGFRFEYPLAFQKCDSERDYEMFTEKWFAVANPGTDPGDVAPSSRDLSALPVTAAAFFIVDQEGGPYILGNRPETHFPLRAASFRPERSAALAKGASWLSLPLEANGWSLSADVYFGPKASSADRATVWRIVSSLRFRSLRTGQVTGNDSFLVLKKASSYPVGYVHRLGARKLRVQAYLVRARHGFYGIGGLAMGNRGDFPCPMRFDRSRFEFACANGPRRWNRVGRPLWTGANYHDYLGVLIDVKVGQDGHVLFSPSVTAAVAGASALEKKYWG
jgi:hypothetical protein